MLNLNLEQHLQDLEKDPEFSKAIRMLQGVWDRWLHKQPEEVQNFCRGKDNPELDYVDEVWFEWTESLHDKIRGEM